MGRFSLRDIAKILSNWRNFLIVFLLPLILLPIAVSESKIARCAFGVVVIAVYWVFEVMPLAVTSLLPVLLFPLLRVIPVKQICASYFKDTLMLFLGSLIVAVAVEKWNLHRRIALRALTLVGTNPRWLMLGIMLPCWFLSMWMSNTATTAMMVPILNAILTVIKDSIEKGKEENVELMENKAARHKENNHVPTENDSTTIELEETPLQTNEQKVNLGDNDDFKKLAKTFALCTAFAANTGGMATLTGTPPNIIFKGQADILFAKYNLDSGITFANWLIVGFPLSLICMLFTWVWLQFFYSGIKFLPCFKKDSSSYDNVKQHLKRAYDSLGPMSFAEIVVLIDFIILAVLWISRKPEFVPGWGSLFPKGYTGDSVAAVLMGAVLFALPSRIPRFLLCCRPYTDTDKEKEEDLKFVPLLDWDTVNRKMAWGVILLMGGGFALADACQKSGLSEWVSVQLAEVMGGLPTLLTALILAFIVAAATNVTSNAATATLFLPIVGKLAIDLQIHPLNFMIPVTIAASFAFLLPVGTPPNAIVFSTGYLQVKDMVVAGSLVNLVTVLFLILAMFLWIAPFYGLSEFPSGFLQQIATNASVAVNGTNV